MLPQAGAVSSPLTLWPWGAAAVRSVQTAPTLVPHVKGLVHDRRDVGWGLCRGSSALPWAWLCLD